MKSFSKTIFISVFVFFNVIFPQSKEKRLEDGIIYITNYVASAQFDSLSKNHNDLDLVDSIYFNTVKFYDYNYSEALLALTLACLPIKSFNIKIPLLGTIVPLYVPVPITKLTNKKNFNLPKYFLINKKINDVDKLSHFFGNAFFSYNLQNVNFTNLLGFFVEYFEAIFKVEGALDKRDIFVNKLGINFGLELKFNKFVKPSDYFYKLNNYSEKL